MAMMNNSDPITQYNQETWNRLSCADVPCSRPKRGLTAETAREWLDNEGLFGNDLTNTHVLCLASAGGQQSLAFALLGAHVTVVDFSEEQLKKDRAVAEEYGKDIRLIQADMRDLSMLYDEEFHVVYQPYSLNYIPDVTPVFDEVARVVKPGGVYHLMFHNPFVHGTWKDGCWGSRWEAHELWKGKGYPLWQPYQEGHRIETDDAHWNYANQEGHAVRIKSPQEFKHTLSTIVNGLLSRGFTILRLDEYAGRDYTAEPGTWEHYISHAPPWLFVWARKMREGGNFGAG